MHNCNISVTKSSAATLDTEQSHAPPLHSHTNLCTIIEKEKMQILYILYIYIQNLIMQVKFTNSS